MTPPTLKAKEFEELLMQASRRLEGGDMVRYGTQASIGADGKPMAVQSLPDFEGVFGGGRQFIIEAKVCSQASFPIDKSKIKPRQVSHMLTRSRCGVPCFVLLHFNERRGKTFHEPAETIAIVVSDALPLWQAFLDAAAEAKRTKTPFVSPGSINREMASRIGRRVEWTCPKGSRKHLPDLAALLGLTPSIF